tara:strand:- start:1425 stop:1631 length:207 start_codon:yes stop_codon:yes gene_type:complete
MQHDNTKYNPHTKKEKHGVFSFLKKDRTLRFHIGDRAKTQIQESYYVHADTFVSSYYCKQKAKIMGLA